MSEIDLIAELRKGDGNGCRQPNDVMRRAADALEAAHMHVETIGDFLQAEIAERERMESECVEHRAQHAEWVAKAEAERDEALDAIAELRALCRVSGTYGPDEFGMFRSAMRQILSRIPEHPKED